MKKLSLKLWSAVLCICILCSCLCGCSLLDGLLSRFGGRIGTTEYTYVLTEATDFYAEPDWDATVVATYYAGHEVTYEETLELDDALWARAEQGWFVLEDFRPEPVEIYNTRSVNIRAYAIDAIPLYKEPATYSNTLFRVTPGRLLEVFLLADTAEGTWGQTRDGWVNMRSVYEEGMRGDHYCFGVTRDSRVSFYDVPGNQAAAAYIVESGMRFEILEQLCIDGLWWGYTENGWVCMEQIYEEGTIGKRPCSAVVIDRTPLNVRVAPGTDNPIITTLRNGDYVQILERVERNGSDWGYTGVGWIYMDLTEIQ